MDERRITLTEQELKSIVRETVNATLTSLGIDHDDPIEMQRDFQHLRSWRQARERISNQTLVVAVGIVITGLASAIWLSLKNILNQ